MIWHCKKLLTVQLLRSFGINETLNSRDKGKRSPLYLLGISWLAVGVIIFLLVTKLAQALCIIGASSLVLPYLLAMTSVFVLGASIFRASSTIFHTKDYDLLMSMPIKPHVIVLSRFLTMYIGNLLISALVMISGSVIYLQYEASQVSFYLMMILSIFLLPMIPMLIATFVGAFTTVISTRFKYSNIVSIVLMILWIIGYLMFTVSSRNTDVKSMGNFAAMITEQINNIYPLAPIFTNAFSNNDWLSFGTFTGLSLILFLILVAIFAWRYESICTSFSTQNIRHKYVMGTMTTRSPLKAFYIKEMKRYFSNSSYVMNTASGYVFMLILSTGILISGSKILSELFGNQDIVTGITPFLLCFFCSASPVSASSLSLEGRQWWILCTMPVNQRTIYNSKLLVHLTLAVPSCLISSLLLSLTIPMNIPETIWIFALPLSFSLFSAVAGIFLNIHFPNFEWENEAAMVKQSAANSASIFIGVIGSIIPCLIILSASKPWINAISGITLLALLLMTYITYRYICKVPLKNIE